MSLSICLRIPLVLAVAELPCTKGQEYQMNQNDVIMWYHNCKYKCTEQIPNISKQKKTKTLGQLQVRCNRGRRTHAQQDEADLSRFARTNSSNIQTWGDERRHKSSQIKRKECQNAKLPRSALTKTKTKRGNARGQKCTIRPAREEPRFDRQVKLYKCAKTIRTSYPW